MTYALSLSRKKERQGEARLAELKLSINQTMSELQSAMENFNKVLEPKLIDFYIYKIQSEQNKYEQLLGEYKAMERALLNNDTL